jgi:hypothetical protein
MNITYHQFWHVHHLTKVVKNTTCHDNFTYFVNFAIENFQNLPLIFQIPKGIFNEQTTTIH